MVGAGLAAVGVGCCGSAPPFQAAVQVSEAVIGTGPDDGDWKTKPQSGLPPAPALFMSWALAVLPCGRHLPAVPFSYAVAPGALMASPVGVAVTVTVRLPSVAVICVARTLALTKVGRVTKVVFCGLRVIAGDGRIIWL